MLYHHSLHFVVIKAGSKARKRLTDEVEKALLQSKKSVEKKQQFSSATKTINWNPRPRRLPCCREKQTDKEPAAVINGTNLRL